MPKSRKGDFICLCCSTPFETRRALSMHHVHSSKCNNYLTSHGISNNKLKHAGKPKDDRLYNSDNNDPFDNNLCGEDDDDENISPRPFMLTHRKFKKVHQLYPHTQWNNMFMLGCCISLIKLKHLTTYSKISLSGHQMPDH